MSLVLPRISRVRLTGFDPIFKGPVELSPPPSPGPYLVLGGNGLGKTTILEATAFGIAGPADDVIQRDREDKRYMWGASLFRERLNDAHRAEVQVEFILGTKRIGVRRGMDSETVRGFRAGDGEWINSNAAPDLYAAAIVNDGGYRSVDDFRFLVHRLSYLPESRQNIVWHAETQLRIFLLLCADGDTEMEVREMALRLKELYNEMRHVNVSIGNLAKRLSHAEKKHPEASAPTEKSVAASPPEKLEIAAISSELASTSDRISEILASLESKGKELQALSTDIEARETVLAESEEQFVLRSLQSVEETRVALALHKMVVINHCPYCAQENDDLAREAIERLRLGLCPICGLAHIELGRLPEPTSAKRDLLEEERKRIKLLEETELLQKTLAELRSRDATLRSKATSLEFRLPRITAREKVVVLDNPDNLRSLRGTYQGDYERLTKLHDDLKADIEARYSDLLVNHARNFRLIEDRAREYATDFLGTTCVFTRTRSGLVDNNSRFDFPVLVPHFKGKDRTASRQCSESQAFFLDIAFRIALIEVSQQLSGHSATFICETPENALDLAYAENVAEMFASFAKAKGFSIMTANLQAGGIAEPLLHSVGTTSGRKKRILNLLEHAELSDVQISKRPKLDAQLAQLLKD